MSAVTTEEGRAERGAMTPTFLRRLAVVGGGALAIRVVYVLAFRRHSPLRGDEVFYSFQANALAGGLGFTNPITGQRAADHPPLTALVLTPASWIANNSVLAQRLTMAVVGTVVVLVIGWLGREVAGDAVGITAAVIAALYPQFWVGDGVAMSEPLATLGVALTVGLAYRLVRRPSTGVAAALGLAVGVTVLARAELVLLLLFVVVPAAVLARGVSGARRAGLVGIVTALMVVTIAPWVLFNVVRFDRLTLLSTNDGLTLVGANCATTYHGPGLGFWDLSCMRPSPRGDASVANSAQRKAAFSYARHHLRRVPVVVAARVGRVWGLFRPLQTARFAAGEGRPRWASYLSLALYYVLVPFAIGGVFVARSRRIPISPLLGPVVVVLLTAAIFYGPARFRVPADVSIVVLGAIAFVELGRRRRPPATRTA